LEFLAVHEALQSSLPGDMMVNGYDLFQPGHSASIKHVVFDLLLKTMSKKCVSSPGRKLA
jgi:hypothetical protein